MIGMTGKDRKELCDWQVGLNWAVFAVSRPPREVVPIDFTESLIAKQVTSTGHDAQYWSSILDRIGPRPVFGRHIQLKFVGTDKTWS
jgi:hypothetical protein